MEKSDAALKSAWKAFSQTGKIGAYLLYLSIRQAEERQEERPR